MKRHQLPTLHEHYYMHTLANGMDVRIVSKPEVKTQMAFLAVPFGGLDIDQSTSLKRFEFPAGLAHFLEHKLFENGDGVDVMERFGSLGANVNAFTSHQETVYYFKTSRKNFKTELNLLLDFTQSFTISDAEVEKEKGIIVQELRMYQQMPEQRLMHETYQSLFKAHPIRYDIGGDEASVLSITRKQLETAYQLNYHPSRSILVVVTSHQPTIILDWIEANQNPKRFNPAQPIYRRLANEPKELNRSHHQFAMDIQNAKMTLTFKLSIHSEDRRANLKQEWALRFFLECVFSPINPMYEEWILQGRIHDYFGYDIDVSPDLSFVMFFIESKDEKDFSRLVFEGLMQSIEPYSAYIDLLRRRYKAQVLRSFDDYDEYALAIIRSHFNGLDLDALYHVLDELDFSYLLNAQAMLQNEPFSVVTMHPINRETL